MMSIKPTAGSEAAAADSAPAATHLWLNAPLDAAAPAAGASSASGSASLPAGSSGGHMLLQSQLSVIRSLQSQLSTLKYQTRACIDEFAAAAAATPPGQTAASTASDAAQSVASSAHNYPAIESRMRALHSTYRDLYETLTTRAETRLSGAPAVRKVLDVLSTAVYGPVMEGPAKGNQRPVNELFSTDMHRSALWVHQQQQQQQSNAQTDGAQAADTAIMADDEQSQRVTSATAASDSSASAAASVAAAAAASSDLRALLSASERGVSFHSALLLNLVQCSGLNPFTDVQKQLRTQFAGGSGESAQATVATATQAAAATAPAAATRSASSAAAAGSPAVPSAGALLDATLLALMEKLYARHVQACRAIDEPRRAHADEARRSHQAAVAAAAAASLAPPQPPQPLAPAVYPSLPFLRKIVTTASMASPYAPRAVPAPAAASGAAAASAQTQTQQTVEALVVSIPHVLHAYIQFEEADDADGDADDAEDAEAEAASLRSPLSMRPALRVARGAFRFHRVSVVGWSELGILVDSFAESAFACFREIAAQARAAVESFDCTARREIRAENIKAAATAAAGAATAATSTQAPPPPPELHRAHTPLPASAASAASASSSSSSASDWSRTPQLRALYHFISWLSTYSDLFSRPCADCKLHLSASAPSTLAFAAAADAAESLTGECADPASFPAVPLVSHDMAMMPPCVRLHGLHVSECTALHVQCVDKHAQTQTDATH